MGSVFFQRTKRVEPEIDHTLPADAQNLTCSSRCQYFSALYQLALWNGHDCGKNEGSENLKAPIPRADYDRSETTGECGIFHTVRVA